MLGTITGRRGGSENRLTVLIWASTMGAYLLLALGGATALLDGGSACATWPTCGPGLVGDLGDPAVLVALGHRIVAFVVGLLFVATLVGTIRRRVDRVTGAIALATALYPFQVAIGALTATGAVTGLSPIHFALGVIIFALSILGLTWHLEATHAPESSGADPSQTSAGTSLVRTDRGGSHEKVARHNHRRTVGIRSRRSRSGLYPPDETTADVAARPGRRGCHGDGRRT